MADWDRMMDIASRLVGACNLRPVFGCASGTLQVIGAHAHRDGGGITIDLRYDPSGRFELHAPGLYAHVEFPPEGDGLVYSLPIEVCDPPFVVGG